MDQMILPAKVHVRNGTFYFVHRGKWANLGRDPECAVAEAARLASDPDRLVDMRIRERKRKLRNLPPKMHSKNGGFYYVHQNRWIFLGRDLAKATAEYESWHCGIRSKPEKWYVENVLWRAMRNAARRVIPFHLSKPEFMQIVHRANGRCELSGIPFSFQKVEGSSRMPYAPSLDRISSAGEYTPANCRLVCIAVNAALSDWGEPVLRRIAAGMNAGRSRSAIAFT